MANLQKFREPVPFTSVKITYAFWSPRITANREHGLWAVYQQLKDTGRLKAYRLEWKPGSELPAPHVFWDSDVAKWLEGACYSLMNVPDQALLDVVEDVVDRILVAQEEDGYLNPHFTVVEPAGRWTNLRDKHELYCAGHLIEAAIAHHQASGSTRFLDGMCRFADLICQVFGPGATQKHGYPGHEEIELALVKLYRRTGVRRYLDLAAYFIDQRGQTPNYFDLEAQQRGENPGEYWAKSHAYTQSHLPVRQQQEVVGHAVRAMYLYSGMADLTAETGDDDLLITLQTLWGDLTSRKMYLTGGIGASRTNEGFTAGFDLPNREAYAETCAAIGLIFWAKRMLRLSLDSRYADVMERALYNAMLSGVSLEGDRFFYVNPLASNGTNHRQAFFSCSCCPPNINRILPTIGGYVYSTGQDEIDVHLYIQSGAEIDLGGQIVGLTQQTDYPWDGVVCLQVDLDQPLAFALKLRKPGWCMEYRIFVNDQPIPVEDNLQNGYLSLERTWLPGDRVRAQWVTTAHLVYAHPEIKANVGRVALIRGPLVYCLESLDQSQPLQHLYLPLETSLSSHFDPDVLGGVVLIQGAARAVDLTGWDNSLYRKEPTQFSETSFIAIPYFAWDNREPAKMQVWMPEVID